MNENNILEPLKEYKRIYKSSIKDNANSFFDKLLLKSKVDVNENSILVSNYKKQLSYSNKIKKSLDRVKIHKTLLICLSCLFLIGGIISILFSVSYLNKSPTYMFPLLLTVGIILVFLFILILVLTLIKISKKQKRIETKYNNEMQKVNELLNQAYNQIRPLNALYDWNMQVDIINSTVPTIKLDKYFDIKKYDYLCAKYNFKSVDNIDKSMYFIQSGSIADNPFLIYREFDTEITNVVYTGVRTISYYVHGPNGQGHMVTQTLTASITKPGPTYFYKTYLIYACDAAPNLSFSRTESGCKNMDDKAIEKKIKEDSKKAEELERESIKKGGTYTKIGNDEFESLFGCYNRDNEQQFRLLFTPLAQKNFVALIRNKEPFGDDFTFVKSKRLNYVLSNHSQVFDYYGNPRNFYDYDVKESRNKFVNYVCSYFDNLYFDLLPILNIPLYQQYKSDETIFKKDFESNYSPYEHEALANSFNPKLFAHPETGSRIILKTKLLKKDNKSDKVLVTAYSYKVINRIEDVVVVGNDGLPHNVPVPYKEFIPLVNTKIIEIKRLNSSNSNFNSNINSNVQFKNSILNFKNYVYERGMLAFIIDKEEDFNEEIDKSLDKYFIYEKED